MGSQQACALREPPYRCPISTLPYKAVNGHPQPHLTSHKCGLVPVLLSTDLSEPQGFFFLLCKIERDDSSYCALNAGVTQPSFPTVSYSAVPPSLPTSAHRCQEIACYRVRLISGQTALLLSHRHTQVVLCPLLHRLSHRTPKVVNILTEKLNNQTGLFQFSGALIIKDAAEDRD